VALRGALGGVTLGVAGVVVGLLGDGVVVDHFLLEGPVGVVDLLGHLAVFGEFGDHLGGVLLGLGEDVVGQATQLHPVFVDQGLEGIVVARGVLVQHIGIDVAHRGAQDRLQVGGQRGVGLLVDDRLEHHGRLVPARIVVVVGRLMQAEGQVVVGADPLGGVDGAGLQRGEDLAAGHVDDGHAHALHHLAAQARHAHLQAVQVIDGVDLLVVPAAHLHAGGAGDQHIDAEVVIQLVPQLQAAAMV